MDRTASEIGIFKLMENALEVELLRKEYGDFILNDISFFLPTGHIMGFAGQNGAGKTTTVRLILNMAARNKGSIKVLGMDNLFAEQKIKQEIGTLFDEIFFVDNWKVADTEKAIKSFYGNWDGALYRRYAKDFSLPLNKRVKELSRGMKMKLMLACALAHKPKLLILDEPTSGIDPVARMELLEILSSYVSDGKNSVFFSTHITTDLDKIADYMALIENGNLFYAGLKNELLKSYLLIKGEHAQLREELRAKIIGLTLLRTEFEGLIAASPAAMAPAENLRMRTPTIDELVVHLIKQKKNV